MNPRSRALSLAAAALGLLVTAAPNPGAHSASSASETGPGRASCQGQPATIVGAPDKQRLKGTHGDDVIITGGAGTVWALRGNDLICVTGQSSNIQAGPGDDSVTTRGARASSHVGLNGGNDTFAGGSRPDFVFSGHGVDRISTGGGDDVYSPQLGGGTRSLDFVDLGPGNDSARTGPNVAGSLDGGTGVNTLTPILYLDEPQGPWVIDNTTMTGTRDGALRFRWTDFQRFTLFAWSTTGPIAFTGSAANEVVLPYASFVDRPDITAIDMRGGDDRVRYVNMIGPAVGGPGRDRLELIDFPALRSNGPPIRRLTADFQAGTVRTRASRAQVTEFEALLVNRFVTTVLRGTEQNNTLRVRHACHTLMEGLGGNDRLIASARGECSGRLADAFNGLPRVEAHGGTGDDLLIGRRTPDILTGEGGIDTVDGRGGSDRCRAETRLNCERR
jgi:Ca2+-binding RTX toxin-like protein